MSQHGAVFLECIVSKCIKTNLEEKMRTLILRDGLGKFIEHLGGAGAIFDAVEMDTTNATAWFSCAQKLIVNMVGCKLEEGTAIAVANAIAKVLPWIFSGKPSELCLGVAEQLAEMVATTSPRDKAFKQVMDLLRCNMETTATLKKLPQKPIDAEDDSESMELEIEKASVEYDLVAKLHTAEK